MNKLTEGHISTLTKELKGLKIRLDEPLKNHTYIKIGGPADVMIDATTRDELIRSYRLAKSLNIPVFVLGSGSNIVVGDLGIRGLVIKNRADKIRVKQYLGGIKNKQLSVAGAVLEADSGVIVNQLVRHTVGEGLGGLQYFLGLPGTLGGAIYNNSHYQGQLIGDRIKEVLVLDSAGQEKIYTKVQMKFGYDTSILHKTKELVVSATFVLAGGDQDKLWSEATSYAKNRSKTQPLSLPSSGCMFQNISQSQAHLLGIQNITRGAGYLIDQTGLKGTKVGKMAVSDKHANFMVNLGGASAMDVWNLVKLVRRRVKQKFGITLKPEVFFVGEQD